jgi:hypothetical protein
MEKKGNFNVADWNGDRSLGSARVSRAVFSVSPNTSQPGIYQENVSFLQDGSNVKSKHFLNGLPPPASKV